MKCKNCSKELIIPSKIYLNLERYNIGGKMMIASECCGIGYEVKMEINFINTLYKGDKTSDDWGTELTK